jgi:hypothetical protein
MTDQREQELLDHKALVEKVRQLTDKVDKLFATFDTLPADLQDHNQNTTAHPNIRRSIINIDERESEDYANLTSTLNTANVTLNNKIDAEVATRIANGNIIETRVIAAENTVAAVRSGSFSYDNPLDSTVQSKTYLKGNTGNVVINSEAPAGYNMLLKVKSANGVFTEGCYGTKYQLNYTDDSIIAGGNNKLSSSTTLADESGNAVFPADMTIAGTLRAAAIECDDIITVNEAYHAEYSDHADKADWASKALNADNATKATTAVTATTAAKATTADTANTAVHANTAANADTAKTATKANHATTADTATDAAHAVKADVAINADTADTALHASMADRATTAIEAQTAENATKLGGVYTKDDIANILASIQAAAAGTTGSTTHADTATHAIAADSATNAKTATKATKATTADSATYAESAGSAATAAKATLATNATNADTAKTATKATQDGNGNNIVSTYVTKVKLETDIAAIDAQTVHKTGSETITGVKVFTDGISANVTGDVTGNATTATKAIQDINGNAIVTTYATQTTVTALQDTVTKNNTSAIHNTNDETIDGNKTFKKIIAGDITGTAEATQQTLDRFTGGHILSDACMPKYADRIDIALPDITDANTTYHTEYTVPSNGWLWLCQSENPDVLGVVDGSTISKYNTLNKFEAKTSSGDYLSCNVTEASGTMIPVVADQVVVLERYATSGSNLCPHHAYFVPCLGN